MKLSIILMVILTAICAGMGALIGSLFGKAAMSALILGLLPLAWFLIVACFYAIGFTFMKKLFDK